MAKMAKRVRVFGSVFGSKDLGEVQAALFEMAKRVQVFGSKDLGDVHRHGCIFAEWESNGCDTESQKAKNSVFELHLGET